MTVNNISNLFFPQDSQYRHHTIAEQLTEIKEKLNIIEIAMNEDINMNEL